MLPCGEAFDKNLKTAKTLVEQVKKSDRTPLMTCLFEGPSSTYLIIKPSDFDDDMLRKS